jgi:tRNA G18 (ribose-2'-O)-methylase SpoU
MIFINDIEDERISFYRSLRFTPKLHKDNRVFVAEEEKVVVKLLQSDIEIVSIFGTKEYLEQYADLIASKSISDENIYTADISLMKQIVGYRLHYGFLAIGKQPDDVPLSKLNYPLIIFNALANAENAGSIVRNAAAFGFQSIVYDKASVSPYLRRSVRVSMGNVFHMDIHHTNSIIDTINKLKENNCKIISVEINERSKPLAEFKPADNRYCFIFGSEGKGVSPEVLELSDMIIHIPINKEVPSLNVASSSAVILNHFSQL